MDSRRLARILWQNVYSLVLFPLLLAGLHVMSLRDRKIRESLRGRRGLWARLREQAARRDPDVPLVWFHVSSAGELLQAMPVMERLMADGCQCALTVASVSGYRWAERRAARLPRLVVADYLPYDFRRSIRRLLALLRPDAVVHVKFDLWPNVVWEARRAGVPQVLVSATLHGRSHRVTSRLARSLYRSVYGSLDAILAVSGEDAARFLATCPGHPRVETVGDTRFDSVLDRRRALEPPPLPRYVSEQPVVIVGSSWPQDEAHVFGPLREALERWPELVLMLVSHEVHEAHLREIEAAFAGFPLVRFSALDPGTDGPHRVLLVDAVGVLAALYTYGTLAYVGGAFSTGVHNVMEPSAVGVPAIFGPRHDNSPEALDLVREGSAFAVRDGESFRGVLFGLLEDPPRARAAGREAAAYVEANAGAAERCFAIVKQSLEQGLQHGPRESLNESPKESLA